MLESAEMEELCRLYEKGDPRGRFASSVTIALRDGRGFHSGLVDGGLRFPQPGWDEARMEGKSRWLAGFVLDRPRIEALAGLLRRFETVKSLRDVTEMLK